MFRICQSTFTDHVSGPVAAIGRLCVCVWPGNNVWWFLTYRYLARWFILSLPKLTVIRSKFMVTRSQNELEAKMFFFQTYTARRPPKGPKNAVYVPGDLDLWPLTLTFKLVRARDQTCLPCEYGANPFSGSRDISYINKTRGWKGQKIPFCPCDLWPLTLTFKVFRARNQTRLPCEFDANSLSGSKDISHTNKKVTDNAKNRTFCSSLPFTACGNNIELYCQINFFES